MKKKITMLLTISLCFFFILSIDGKAHNVQLNVTYDNCYPENWVNSSNVGDGLKEKWYELISLEENENGVNEYVNKHIPNTNYTTIIKYYFSPYGKDDTSFTWTTLLSDDEYSELKNSFVNSMKKWNNIYFYTTNESGYLMKNKLVNVIEGTDVDHNLTIYPKMSDLYVAGTWPVGDPVIVDNINGVFHKHYSRWAMDIPILQYKNYNIDDLNFFKSSTGAHELGHVLGLRDIDYVENGDNSSKYHHEELLMGYSKIANDESSESTPTSFRQTEITYKDLVGVAITRGYHTDLDHKWIYGNQTNENGQKKLICSICNGIKYVSNLNDYEYVLLNTCQKIHTVSSGNMMAVASYGNKDYYKCKYCRYVAPFESNVQQNYINITSYDSMYHKMVNNVNGLSYTCLVEHNFINHSCVDCGYYKSDEHVFSYSYYNNSLHKATCFCGYEKKEPHVIEATTLNSAICLLCKRIINLDSGIGQIPGLLSEDIKRTLNGSYILPNKIVVLVKEDIEDYFNGTLMFYSNNTTTSSVLTFEIKYV